MERDLTAPGTLAGFIDHTLLAPEATEDALLRLCEEALAYAFFAVCVHPRHVRRAREILAGSPVTVCSVCGFPLGAHLTETKVFEARGALRDGAGEIDMVLPVGALKAGRAAEVLEDVRAVASLCHAQGARCKVILETCLLSDAEKERACALCIEAQADFVKTSTGFSRGGATVEDVRLLSRCVRSAGLGVKASGGIRDLDTALAMIRAGATRLGASAGVALVEAARRRAGG